MNKKRTNYFVVILNFIVIVSIYILFFSYDFLSRSIMSGPSIVKSIYDSNIIDFLMQNTALIVAIICAIIGILNIICGIQNRKNKKILFWQLMLGIYGIIWSVITALDPYEDELRIIKIVICAIIPLTEH